MTSYKCCLCGHLEPKTRNPKRELTRNLNLGTLHPQRKKIGRLTLETSPERETLPIHHALRPSGFNYRWFGVKGLKIQKPFNSESPIMGIKYAPKGYREP